MNKKIMGSEENINNTKKVDSEYLVFVKESQITGRREYLDHIEVKKNNKYIYRQIKEMYSKYLAKLDRDQYDLLSFSITDKQDLEIEGIDTSDIIL